MAGAMLTCRPAGPHPRNRQCTGPWSRTACATSPPSPRTARDAHAQHRRGPTRSWRCAC